jgi:hypothetical protein
VSRIRSGKAKQHQQPGNRVSRRDHRGAAAGRARLHSRAGGVDPARNTETLAEPRVVNRPNVTHRFKILLVRLVTTAYAVSANDVRTRSCQPFARPLFGSKSIVIGC